MKLFLFVCSIMAERLREWIEMDFQFEIRGRKWEANIEINRQKHRNWQANVKAYFVQEEETKARNSQYKLFIVCSLNTANINDSIRYRWQEYEHKNSVSSI